MMAIKTPRNPIELNQIIRALTNRADDTDMIYTFKTDELKFVTNKEVPWTLDGEFGGKHTELLVRNLNKRVQILVP